MREKYHRIARPLELRGVVGVRAVEEVQLACRVCLNACILRNKISLLEVTEQRDGRKRIARRYSMV